MLDELKSTTSHPNTCHYDLPDIKAPLSRRSFLLLLGAIGASQIPGDTASFDVPKTPITISTTDEETMNEAEMKDAILDKLGMNEASEVGTNRILVDYTPEAGKDEIPFALCIREDAAFLIIGGSLYTIANIKLYKGSPDNAKAKEPFITIPMEGIYLTQANNKQSVWVKEGKNDSFVGHLDVAPIIKATGEMKLQQIQQGIRIFRDTTHRGSHNGNYLRLVASRSNVKLPTVRKTGEMPWDLEPAWERKVHLNSLVTLYLEQQTVRFKGSNLSNQLAAGE